jgi:hypothetical protein
VQVSVFSQGQEWNVAEQAFLQLVESLYQPLHKMSDLPENWKRSSLFVSSIGDEGKHFYRIWPQVDSLNEEVTQLKAEEQMHKVSNSGCLLGPCLSQSMG